MKMPSSERIGTADYCSQIVKIMQRNTLVGMAIVDQKMHQIIHVNQALCKMLGYRKKELVGKTMFDLTHPDDLEISYQHAMRIWDDEHCYSKIVKRYSKKDGGFIWAESEGFLLKDNSDNGIFSITFIKDVTREISFSAAAPVNISGNPTLSGQENLAIDVKKLLSDEINKRKLVYNQLLASYENEKKLRKCIQTEMKSRLEFTRIVVHDLKTPLTSIISSSGVLSNIAADGKYKALAANIYESTMNLNTRLDELLDMAQCEVRDPKLNRSRFNIKEMLDHIISIQHGMYNTNHIDFKIIIAPEVSFIIADEDRLRQILDNLIDNAIKYSPDSGLISINISRDQNNVLFSVSDSGIGIEPGEIKNIFKPYYRVESRQKKLQGLGLGLSIVRTYVKLHGGRIWVESEYGKGTTFLFTIPQPPLKVSST
ncbi:MAG: PAS domain-containing sensor histidine kinase [Dehalococcoides mccartyi]|uniref:PAS domain-containing sensor histidine kinase n=1 Tax=Dehalococcoides mccartyi TaxID=61435 RepID=UPI0030F8B747